ncbi:MAG: FAD:protein FMN transferase [Kineosporiaceae bacterium]
MTTTTGQAAAPAAAAVRLPAHETGTARPGPHLHRHTEAALGTVFSFAVSCFDDPAGRARAADAVAAACAVLHRLEAAWDPYAEGSVVSRLRAGQQVDPDLDDPDGTLGIDVVLRRCAAAQRLTKGTYDAWRGPDGFDPSAVVRGWAVERAVARLEQAGFHDLVLGGGGDVTVRGSSPDGDGWVIDLRDPRDGGQVGRVRLSGRAAVASCGGDAASDTAGVSVVGPELGWCDVIASSLLAEGSVATPWLASVPTYRALGIGVDGTLTGDLVAELVED